MLSDFLNAPSRAETSHLKHLSPTTPQHQPSLFSAGACSAGSSFYKASTVFSVLTFLSFPFLSFSSADRAYGACWHEGAQHRNPGTRAVAIAPNTHTTKPCFLLHRPAHMLVCPHRTPLNQIDLQQWLVLAWKLSTHATAHHRNTCCIPEKQNLTRTTGRRNITEWKTKG